MVVLMLVIVLLISNLPQCFDCGENLHVYDAICAVITISFAQA